MLLKVTARQGDDLWIITSGDLLTTPAPTTRAKALRYLPPENGWTMHEVDEPKFNMAVNPPNV